MMGEMCLFTVHFCSTPDIFPRVCHVARPKHGHSDAFFVTSEKSSGNFEEIDFNDVSNIKYEKGFSSVKLTFQVDSNEIVFMVQKST